MTTTVTSTYDRVVELLNQASLLPRDVEKIRNLKIVEELIVNKEPNLLDSFLDEMLAFQSDRSVEVKKYIVHFMAVAGKADEELLPRIVGNMMMTLKDTNVKVVKTAILNVSHVYKATIKWMATSRVATPVMLRTWNQVARMKSIIEEFIENDNEGIRSSAIKFLEVAVLILSMPPDDPEVIKSTNGKGNNVYVDDINLSLVPENHATLKIEKLLEEGRETFDKLMGYQSTNYISSINLMIVMTSMTSVARFRPVFMGQVVQGFESLHVNLPPTLTKSQVSSVRKHLKMQMLTLLRHPAAGEYQSNIAILLTDLGASQSEVMKNMAKVDNRKRKAEDSTVLSKKAKLDNTQQSFSNNNNNVTSNKPTDVELVPTAVAAPKFKQAPPQAMKTSAVSGSSSASAVAPATIASDEKPAALPAAGETLKHQSAIDITADDLVARLTAHNVADLVLLSMVMLPEDMPASFQATYTPIAAAGTPVQIKHMARLLAAQLTNAKLGKGYEMMEAQKKAELEKQKESKRSRSTEDNSMRGGLANGGGGDDDDVTGGTEEQTIGTVLGGSTIKNDEKPIVQEDDDLVSFVPSVQPSKKNTVPFRLSQVTKPLSPEEASALAKSHLKRLQESNHMGVIDDMRWKMIVRIASMNEKHRDDFLEYVFSDLRNRSSLAIELIYQEYYNYTCLAAAAGNMVTDGDGPLAKYENCVVAFLRGLLDRPDQKDGTFFNRVVLEAPTLTPKIVQVLKDSCLEDSRIYFCMTTMKELILKRPKLKFDFLDMLLDFATHEKSEVRQNAIRVIKSLHERSDLQGKIEEHAMMLLRYLLLPVPPKVVKVDEELESWSEEAIRLCLYLYLGLLPVKHELIHELASVYLSSSNEIKRVILRVIETPVKGMGMDSPELLLLVENCPKGTETLITRIIHILTDKVVPSPELVDKVRDLYQKRVSDVRFLIPVLNGLSKNEVVAALPRLIKLNPVVVKEVFNRLLGVNGQENKPCSLNPTELLITLHTLDTKVDMKTLIKACSICFQERSVYTQEVLAVVMQQLMDMNPLPILLMRTVMQSLSTYPKLSGFVLNILQRLVAKQVWKNRKVYEGFVKCCQKTKPQSFQIMLQLPPTQLRDAFVISPELREPLLNHVISLTPHQRAHIPKAVVSVLEKVPEKPASGNLQDLTVASDQVKVKQEGGESKTAVQNIVSKDPQGVQEFFKSRQPIISIDYEKNAPGRSSEDNDLSESYEVGGISDGEELEENAIGSELVVPELPNVGNSIQASPIKALESKE